MTHILEYNPQLEMDLLPFEGVTISQVANMPKVDLHRHLVGAIRPKVLVYIADRLGVSLPSGNDFEHIERTHIMNRPVKDGYKYFLGKKFWGTFQHIFRSAAGSANAIYWAIADASRDNVCYVEFRVSPYGVDPQRPSQLRNFIKALKEGIDAASRDYPKTLTKIILSIGRRSVFEKWEPREHTRYFDSMIKTACAFRDVVVGFDISGNEDQYPNHKFQELAERIKSNQFKLTVHAGETGSAQSVWEALRLLQADRIGHGLGIGQDRELADYMSSAKIPVEVCPTSNFILGLVPNLEKHPCRDFIDQGLRVTVNTDDPVLLGPTTLSMEYYELFAAKQIAAMEVPNLARNSIAASFASEAEKTELSRIFDNYCLEHPFSSSLEAIR